MGTASNDRFAKPLYWLIPVPRVRIPPSPPEFYLRPFGDRLPQTRLPRNSDFFQFASIDPKQEKYMARETVGLYIRLSSVRTNRKVNPKSKTQPSGTFCLRYKHHGKRIWRTMAGCGTPAGTQCGRRIGETARNDPHVCRRRCDPARYRVDRHERREGLRAGSAIEKLELNRCSVLHSNKLRPNLFGL